MSWSAGGTTCPRARDREAACTPPYGTNPPRPARTPNGAPRDAKTPAKPETVSGPAPGPRNPRDTPADGHVMFTHWLRGYDVAQQTCPFRMFMEQCDCTCNWTSNPKGCQASDVHWYHELCIKNIWQKRCLKFIERHYHIPSSWNRWGSLCPDIRLLLGTGESSVSPFAPERQSFPLPGSCPSPASWFIKRGPAITAAPGKRLPGPRGFETFDDT